MESKEEVGGRGGFLFVWLRLGGGIFEVGNRG